MLFTRTDPREAWRAGRVDGLPTGAREAPLDWVCTTRVESHGHFDKDAQGEVFYDVTTVTGWRAEPDPRVHQAGALSFHGIEHLESGVLSNMPGVDRLGTSISALTLQGHQLSPRSLECIGQARPWTDLSIWAARWSPASRAAGVRELASFPSLLGLELHTASLDAGDLLALSKAVERLEDLMLTNCPLDRSGMRAIAERLGSLVHLDLSEADQGPELIRLLAPKLTRAKRLQLARNPIGDEGVRTLLEAGALEHGRALDQLQRMAGMPADSCLWSTESKPGSAESKKVR